YKSHYQHEQSQSQKLPVFLIKALKPDTEIPESSRRSFRADKIPCFPVPDFCSACILSFSACQQKKHAAKYRKHGRGQKRLSDIMYLRPVHSVINQVLLQLLTVLI